MEFLKSLKVAASGLKAQTGRMRVIAENIANAESVAATPEADPYRRRVPTFKTVVDRELNVQMVEPSRIKMDQSAFRMDFDPGHPAANEDGYVKKPNVNSLIESVDLREAQRSYEANLNIVTATRRMMSRTLDILRS
ncbi:MAG: flagellar basal body rod protein FlgC [Pseudomonadota bacterium]